MPRALPSQERLRALFSYCSATGDLRWRCRPVSDFVDLRAARIWNARFPGKPFGNATSTRTNGYVHGDVDRVAYTAHRLIWKLMTDEEPPEIDHKDGNRSNNALGNLRAANRLINAQNTRGWAKRTAPYKGTKLEANGKWTAQIMRDGKRMIRCGFATPEEASAAYQAMSDHHAHQTNT